MTLEELQNVIDALNKLDQFDAMDAIVAYCEQRCVGEELLERLDDEFGSVI